MPAEISLDGRTLAAVANSDAGEVNADTRFHFEQDGDRIHARYSGGEVLEGPSSARSTARRGTSGTHS